MRTAFFGLTLGVAAVTAGCVSLQSIGEPPVTPLRIIAWDGAPEGPYEAHVGDRLVTQYVTPRLLVTLDENLVSIGARAPLPIAKGTTLFGVVDERGGERYCTSVDDDVALACFEDSDHDGSFDRGYSAAGSTGAFTLAVRRWTGRFDIVGDAPYRQADAASGPLAQIGLAYLGRSVGGRYGFGLEVGGPDGWAALPTSTTWLKRDGRAAFDVAGAAFEVTRRNRDNAIVYRLDSALAGDDVTLHVSTASRTMGDIALYPRG